MAKQISIEHAFKVFGDAPEAALALVREGHSKNEILARTGQSIGVFDAHFDIGAGEIFVVMGLSGSGKYAFTCVSKSSFVILFFLSSILAIA